MPEISGNTSRLLSCLSTCQHSDINDHVHIEGYGEFDFLGNAQTGNSNQTNSYNPRIRAKLASSTETLRLKR